MKNADEFVDKLLLQSNLMAEFLKKHPEIAKLDSKSRYDLMLKLLI